MPYSSKRTVTSDGISSRYALGDSILDTLPGCRNVVWLERRRSTTRDDSLFDMRSNHCNFFNFLGNRQDATLVSEEDHPFCGELPTEFASLGRVAAPLDSVAIHNVGVSLRLLLDEGEEVGDALVNGREEQLLGGEGVVD